MVYRGCSRGKSYRGCLCSSAAFVKQQVSRCTISMVVDRDCSKLQALHMITYTGLRVLSVSPHSVCLMYTYTGLHILSVRPHSVYLYWELASSDGSENYSAHTINLRELEKRLNSCRVHILHIHLHLGHLSEAFIQSILQKVHLSKKKKQFIAVDIVRMFIETSEKKDS